MTKQIGFSFDVTRCTGCIACIVACQDQNDLYGDGVSFRHVTKLEKGEYPSVEIAYLSISCQHCGDAPCLMVSPTGAIYKRDENGIVDIHGDLCVVCHSCALACPFGAPQFPEGRMLKGNFCRVRLDSGLEPACIRVCPTRALAYGPREQLEKAKAIKRSLIILNSLIK